jgi:hypothetical protein
VPSELADVPPALALPPVATVPAALQSCAVACTVANRNESAIALNNSGLFIIVSYYLPGFMMEQVPSERFVMTVPSGRVTLALE